VQLPWRWERGGTGGEGEAFRSVAAPATTSLVVVAWPHREEARHRPPALSTQPHLEEALLHRQSRGGKEGDIAEIGEPPLSNEERTRLIWPEADRMGAAGSAHASGQPLARLWQG
jgi:hypothetical protein